MSIEKPWTTNSYEIMRHVLSLWNKGTDSNKRIAMILTDNAIEQMIKVYLNLPKGITGISIPKARRDEIAESFPKMLEAFKEFAPSKCVGIDIHTIEWHHRQRNELYHAGFGLTITKENLEIYMFMAATLYQNLFDMELFKVSDFIDEAAFMKSGSFLAQYTLIASFISKLTTKQDYFAALSSLRDSEKITEKEKDELVIAHFAHGQLMTKGKMPTEVTDESIARLATYASRFIQMARDDGLFPKLVASPTDEPKPASHPAHAP